MFMVFVILCDIQLPACFSILEVESTCFVRICTQVIPIIVLAHLMLAYAYVCSATSNW